MSFVTFSFSCDSLILHFPDLDHYSLVIVLIDDVILKTIVTEIYGDALRRSPLVFIAMPGMGFGHC